MSKIIVVNLKGTLLESISDFLTMWGYSIIIAETAETIVGLAPEDDSVLIIFQFLEFSEREFQLFFAIREKTPHLPIVATAPFISVQDIFKVVKAGAVDYLMQPFNPLELKKLVEKYLETSLPILS